MSRTEAIFREITREISPFEVEDNFPHPLRRTQPLYLYSCSYGVRSILTGSARAGGICSRAIYIGHREFHARAQAL